MTNASQNEPVAVCETLLPNLQIWEPEAIQWELDRPQGCKLTLPQGDWNTPGVPFTYAFFMPDGAWFPPHAHPSDARVVVIKGNLLLGQGSTMDTAAVRILGPGSTAFVPANLAHYEGSKGETIIIGSAVHPWGTNFVEG